MKQFLKEFFLRAFIAAGSGPLVLAMIYGILGATGAVATLTPREVCLGIISVTFLAATMGGMSAIYQMERLPLPCAIAIHCIVLYAVYILVYLITGWLKTSIGIFTVIFFLGYALVWLTIYIITRKRTEQLNRKLQSGV